jgi:hypothetical protein
MVLSSQVFIANFSICSSGWNCGKKGHLKKDYRAPKKQRDGQQEKNQEANLTGDLLQDASILSVDNISESWVVDSGD